MKALDSGWRTTWLLLALLGIGCGTPPGKTDGGDSGDLDIDRCVIDNSIRRGTAPEWQIEAGATAKTGMLCPAGDTDHYWFDISQERSIVQVNLKTSLPMSPVDLCYELFREGQDARLGGQCDHEGMDGVTDLSGTHYLAETGRYFLEVRDEGGDEEDPRAIYSLGITTVQDPDTYEPNDSKDKAKDPSSAKGYISYLGDEDWFKITSTQSDQVLRIDLTASKLSVVDLEYTLFLPDGTTPVNSFWDDNGMDEATEIHDVLPLPGSGTFYLRISDVNGDDTDLESGAGYSLQLTVRANPDSNEPNNTWELATVLQKDAGGTAQIDNGYIGNRGDVDWYVIEAPGVSDTAPALLEIDLQIANSGIDLAVDLIVADPHFDCTTGDACDMLGWECGSLCHGECAHAQCPGHECWEARGHCRGADMCLDRGDGKQGCGIRSLVMFTNEWSEATPADANHLHTVAPMYGPRYYLYVRDYSSANSDLDHAYQLTVRVLPELDGNEPNGLYLPYLTADQERATRRWNYEMATPITCARNGDTITCPIQGVLSFRGDQDWYRLDNFLVQEAESVQQAQSKWTDWDVNFKGWTYNGKQMDIGVLLNVPGRDDKDTGPTLRVGTNQDWGEGPEECSYFCGEYDLPASAVFLWVFTPDFKGYDTNQPYSLTIEAKKGCPANCSYCEANQCCFACPNPINPDPVPCPEQCF